MTIVMAGNHQERLGLDPKFKLLASSGLTWCFVLDGVGKTASALRKELGAKRWLKDVINKDIRVEGNYFAPFRVTGNNWTNLVGLLGTDEPGLSPELMMALSKRQKTRTIFAVYEDTSAVFLYVIFENGEPIEFLHWDGSPKPKILAKANSFFGGSESKYPAGFCFYSRLRKLRAGELTGQVVEQFFGRLGEGKTFVASQVYVREKGISQCGRVHASGRREKAQFPARH